MFRSMPQIPVMVFSYILQAPAPPIGTRIYRKSQEFHSLFDSVNSCVSKYKLTVDAFEGRRDLPLAIAMADYHPSPRSLISLYRVRAFKVPS